MWVLWRYSWKDHLTTQQFVWALIKGYLGYGKNKKMLSWSLCGIDSAPPPRFAVFHFKILKLNDLIGQNRTTNISSTLVFRSVGDVGWLSDSAVICSKQLKKKKNPITSHFDKYFLKNWLLWCSHGWYFLCWFSTAQC